MLGLIHAAEQAGLNATGVRACIADLQGIPLPAIVHLIKDGMHHYAVLYKMSEKKVWIMDPASGRLEKWDREMFIAQWTGVVLLVSPSLNFREGKDVSSTFTRFWNLYRPHASMILQALTAAILYTVLGFSSAIYLQKLTDIILPHRDFGLLRVLSLIMLSIILVQAFLQLLRELYLLRTSHLMDIRLIMGYYNHLCKLPQPFFDGMQVGEILSRVGDAVKIRNLINQVGVDLMVNTLTLLCTIGLLLTYSWKLAIFMIALWPLYVLLFIVYNRINRRTEREIMEKAAGFESRMIEFIKSSRLWRTYGLKVFFRDRVGRPFFELMNAGYNSGNNAIMVKSIAVAIAQLAVLLSLWTGGWLVMENEISIGELLSFYALVGYFTAPVIRLVQANKEIQNALIAADRLFEILDMKFPTSRYGLGDDTTIGGRETLRVEKLGYAHKGHLPILKDVSLALKPGMIYGLVGKSGSGKSTLLDLIQGIYEADTGLITVGEIDLADLNPSARRENIGVVREGEPLIEGSVMENILLNGSHNQIPRLKAVCKMLEMDSFIENHAQGYHRPVGLNGQKLSMGQRQRVILARLLLRQQKFLFLDEATSALDAQAERRVMKCLKDRAASGTAILIVSHRMSLIRETDHIMVLEDGCIRAAGSHENLIAQNKLYRSFCKEQACLV